MSGHIIDREISKGSETEWYLDRLQVKMINYLQGFCGPGNFLWLLRSCVLRGFGPRAQGDAV